jgi:stearoyl-CoA desaturase (delta-9 desaturase)
MGLFLIVVALTGYDAIRKDCERQRFFPSEKMNWYMEKPLNLLLLKDLGAVSSGVITTQALTTMLFCFGLYMYTDFFQLTNMFSSLVNFLWYVNVCIVLPVLAMRLTVWSFTSHTDEHIPLVPRSPLRKGREQRGPTNGLAAAFEQRVFEVMDTVEEMLPGEKGEQKSLKKGDEGVEGMPFSGRNSKFILKTLEETLDMVPMYHFNKMSAHSAEVLSKLYKDAKIAAEHELKDAVTVPGNDDLSADAVVAKRNQQSSELTASNVLRVLFYIILAPIRAAYRNVFLFENESWTLYFVALVYLVCVYVASFHHAWAPFCVITPFLSPKSSLACALDGKIQEILEARRIEMEQKVKEAEKELEDSCEAQRALVKKDIAAARELLQRNLKELDELSRTSRMAGFLKYVGKMNLKTTALFLFWHIVAFYAIWQLWKSCMWSPEDYTDPIGSLRTAFGVNPTPQPIMTKTMWWAFWLYPITAFVGITGGVHRLWSHRSFQASFLVRLVFMIANSIASQGTIYHWARDHRVHHLHSDTPADPHDASRGFFFSHVGWFLLKKEQAVIDAGKKLDLRDLHEDGLVMFQKRMDPWWNLAWCFAFPAFVATIWGDTAWNGFLIAGGLRWVWVLHVTWTVNSINHAIGESPYDPTERPSESRIVSFLAGGEGWHSWHHTFAFDYAASELGALQQWNPTKVMIDVLALLGQVWGRKRGTRMWNERKAYWQKKRPDEVMVEELHGPPMWKVRTVRWEKKEKPAEKPSNEKTEKVE